MVEDNDIEYRLMEEADGDGVYSLLTECFVREAPLSVAFKLEESQAMRSWIRFVIDTCGNNGLSIIAVDRTDAVIVGVRLSAVTTKGDDLKLKPKAKADPLYEVQIKMEILAAALNSLYDGVDIFAMYGVDEYIQFKVLNVRKEYGKRGIGQRLVKEATRVSRELGYRLFVVVVTGNYSRRLYEKLEYDVLKTIVYEDYVDDNGRRIIGDTGEHEAALLMAKIYD